ncbi:MAG: cyclase family protein, partial [Deltaproteobacteria bacterium]|nr:cyclase family protein [Deltaproteobacteria bacterium]
SKLVKQGKVFDMGTPYGSDNPGFPPRYWHNTTLAHRLFPPLGTNKFTWLEEQFSGCPGVGTQTDNPAHVGIEYQPGDIRFYNGFKLNEVVSGTALAVKYQDWPAIVTRGVLVDMVDFKGHELQVGETITAAEIQECLKKHNLELNPGDALLIRTGWMRWFKEDPKKFMSGEPGVTVEVADWTYQKHLSTWAVDQWSSEVVPMVDKTTAWPVHCKAIAEYGFTWGQDWIMEELAADCKKDGVYEFMLVNAVAKITGITQGISAPIAIK